MEGGQRIQPGAHAPNLNTACKGQRNELELAPILLRRMVEMNVGDWQSKKRAVLLRLKDAQVRSDE